MTAILRTRRISSTLASMLIASLRSTNSLRFLSHHWSAPNAWSNCVSSKTEFRSTPQKHLSTALGSIRKMTSGGCRDFSANIHRDARSHRSLHVDGGSVRRKECVCNPPRDDVPQVFLCLCGEKN